MSTRSGSTCRSIRAATTPCRGSGARPASSSNTTLYKGDINTSAIFLDPPPELKGKINVVPEMNDVMSPDHQVCRRRVVHRRQGDAEEGARQADRSQAELDRRWTTATIEKFASRRLRAPACTGTARPCARACKNPTCVYGYPEGRLSDLAWTTSASSRTPRTSRTPSCSMNFIMDPENAAMISAFANYANGIKGSGAVHAGRHEGRAGDRGPGRVRGQGRSSCSPARRKSTTSTPRSGPNCRSRSHPRSPGGLRRRGFSSLLIHCAAEGCRERSRPVLYERDRSACPVPCAQTVAGRADAGGDRARRKGEQEGERLHLHPFRRSAGGRAQGGGQIRQGRARSARSKACRSPSRTKAGSRASRPPTAR